MKVAVKKTPKILFPRRKLEQAVKAAIPAGQSFKIQVRASGIDNAKIVRIITPAWSRQRPYQRIEKILRQMDERLTEHERRAILRVNVLTPQEYQKRDS